MRPNLPASRHFRLSSHNAIHFKYWYLFVLDSICFLSLICQCPQSKIHIAKRHRKHYSFLRTCAPLLFIFSVFLLISLMYWLYFDLREQLSDHRSKIEQGECKPTNMIWHFCFKHIYYQSYYLNIWWWWSIRLSFCFWFIFEQWFSGSFLSYTQIIYISNPPHFMVTVSAFCSSMPETLQKLHESSKTLETNQTAISQKIYEVQQHIETVEKEVSWDSIKLLIVRY